MPISYLQRINQLSRKIDEIREKLEELMARHRNLEIFIYGSSRRFNFEEQKENGRWETNTSKKAGDNSQHS